MRKRSWRAAAIASGALVAAAFQAGSSRVSADPSESSGTQKTMAAPPLPSPAAMIARAKPLELDTPYVPPPGDPLEHHTSGYAKTMCSAVFITGLDPDVAAESVGYFAGPYEERRKVAKPVVDRVKKEVRIAMPNGVTLIARHFGSQGCITLPPGRDDVFFKPVVVRSKLSDATTMPWPMGAG